MGVFGGRILCFSVLEFLPGVASQIEGPCLVSISGDVCRGSGGSDGCSCASW